MTYPTLTQNIGILLGIEELCLCLSINVMKCIDAVKDISSFIALLSVWGAFVSHHASMWKLLIICDRKDFTYLLTFLYFRNWTTNLN